MTTPLIGSIVPISNERPPVLNPAYVRKLQDEVRELRAKLASEHERAERLERELSLAVAGEKIAIMQEKGEVTAEVRADFVHGMTALLAGWFQDKGGVNNVELRAFHPDLGPFTMTIQRQGKQSPAEQRDEARQVAAQLLRLARELDAGGDWWLLTAPKAWAALSPALRKLVEE